ncbi:hypothetical protein CCMA1212_003190 [Trichoderma ghanense]|uniref:Uncharacterized protein n=1 Tax=Trichoderma ghanense TaxID=65468 RepID=A0ABY2HB19_9HYPO
MVYQEILDLDLIRARTCRDSPTLRNACRSARSFGISRPPGTTASRQRWLSLGPYEPLTDSRSRNTEPLGSSTINRVEATQYFTYSTDVEGAPYSPEAASPSSYAANRMLITTPLLSSLTRFLIIPSSATVTSGSSMTTSRAFDHLRRAGHHAACDPSAFKSDNRTKQTAVREGLLT